MRWAIRNRIASFANTTPHLLSERSVPVGHLASNNRHNRKHGRDFILADREEVFVQHRNIDGARAATGMAVEQIRDMHFSLQHCDMIGKQLEIIDLVKKYGFIFSCGPNYITAFRNWIKDYGARTPNIEDFFLPFNTWINSGVKLVGQHYGGGTLRGGKGGGSQFQPPFFMLWQAIPRKYDGKVWEPDERIDRVHALKMWTRWAADYVRRPNELGSLETSKFADLLIIDRDYFTIPVDDILKIRPLMTMVGGRIVSLNGSLAKEWGAEPVGPQFNFDDKQIEWIEKAITEDGRRETGSGG